MKKYSRTFLKKLYKAMLKIRLCEESLVEPIISGAIRCPVHLYTGQEAIAAGVCASLADVDYVFGTHRSHGHFLARGGSLNELVAEIYGKNTGCSRGRGGSMHLYAPEKGLLGTVPIVAGAIPLAVGCALAEKNIHKSKRVTVVFFGDGAVGEGVLYESLNIAALKKLPIIFVCENNHYSTHLPIKECRCSDRIFKIGTPFGIPGFRVDGNDVLKVHEMSKKAVKSCRAGLGPVFIEFVTYRLCGHVGGYDNIHGTQTDIRPRQELELWKTKDPVRRFEKYLLKTGAINRKEISSINKKVEKEIRAAYIFAKKSPYPTKEDLVRYVFKK